MKRLLALILMTGTAASLQAAGSTALGGTFNDVGMGTRPLGMGGAFVALADDANAVQENPAGMAFFEKKDRFATLTHSNLFSLSALSRDFVAYAQGDTGFGAFGLSWNRFAADLSPEQWTEDTFAYSGGKVISGAGEDSWPKTAVGWQVKYMRVDSGFSDDPILGTTVGGGTATGYGVGAGLLIRLRPSLSIGVSGQDLYSSLSWATGTLEIIPATARGGLAYRLTDKTTFAAEVRGAQTSSGFTASSWHVGAENWLFDGKALMWNVIKNVGVRGGYFQQMANSDAGQVTLGGTAKADVWQIDYTYQFGMSNQSLGATHRFGVGMTF